MLRSSKGHLWKRRTSWNIVNRHPCIPPQPPGGGRVQCSDRHCIETQARNFFKWLRDEERNSHVLSEPLRYRDPPRDCRCKRLSRTSLESPELEIRVFLAGYQERSLDISREPQLTCRILKIEFSFRLNCCMAQT